MRANESLIIRRVAEPSAPTSRGVSVYVRTASVTWHRASANDFPGTRKTARPVSVTSFDGA